MAEIRKSEHKNYLPSYPFPTKEIIEKYILPNQKDVFEKFSEKIKSDAEKDGKRWRKFLESQWLKAASTCKIISILSVPSEWNDESQLVEEIIDMDYQSVADFFWELVWFFEKNTPINQELSTLKELFEAMRKVSKGHTNVIKKELVSTLDK